MPYNGRMRIIDGDREARLISIACSTPPEGYAKGTMQMSANELVVLNVVESISGQTVSYSILFQMPCHRHYMSIL